MINVPSRKILQLRSSLNRLFSSYHESQETGTHLEVKLLMWPVVVLNWLARAKMSAIPIPESKSGVIAAKVMINNWKFLRKSDHCHMKT